MMYNYGYGFDAGFGAFALVWHLFWVIIGIAFIVWVVRMVFGGCRHGKHFHKWAKWQSFSAIETLNERFAKGEIDKAEYEERKKVLLGE